MLLPAVSEITTDILDINIKIDMVQPWMGPPGIKKLEKCISVEFSVVSV